MVDKDAHDVDGYDVEQYRRHPSPYREIMVEIFAGLLEVGKQQIIEVDEVDGKRRTAESDNHRSGRRVAPDSELDEEAQQAHRLSHRERIVVTHKELAYINRELDIGDIHARKDIHGGVNHSDCQKQQQKIPSLPAPEHAAEEMLAMQLDIPGQTVKTYECVDRIAAAEIHKIEIQKIISLVSIPVEWHPSESDLYNQKYDKECAEFFFRG